MSLTTDCIGIRSKMKQYEQKTNIYNINIHQILNKQRKMFQKYQPKYYKKLLLNEHSEVSSPESTDRYNISPTTLMEQNILLKNKLNRAVYEREKLQKSIRKITEQFVIGLRTQEISRKVQDKIQGYLLQLLNNINKMENTKGNRTKQYNIFPLSQQSSQLSVDQIQHLQLPQLQLQQQPYSQESSHTFLQQTSQLTIQQQESPIVNRLFDNNRISMCKYRSMYDETNEHRQPKQQHKQNMQSNRPAVSHVISRRKIFKYDYQ